MPPPNTKPPPSEPKTLGQVGFDAYGDSGPVPWVTFDGRPMPPWEDLDTPGGRVTRARWEAAALAIVAEAQARFLSLLRDQDRFRVLDNDSWNLIQRVMGSTGGVPTQRLTIPDEE